MPSQEERLHLPPLPLIKSPSHVTECTIIIKLTQWRRGRFGVGGGVGAGVGSGVGGGVGAVVGSGVGGV
jgi:hypothetical protein